ncbi:MAG: hypothetical protein EOP49_39675 [Sphingobacteriales bacterium]|nr:MAG: hypothetical protein EOP49_39675 [Sphingobacteriales bacterium]
MMNLKQMSCIFFLWMCSWNASAKTPISFNIDLSLARFGSEVGPGVKDIYYGPLTFFNTLKAGVSLDKIHNVRLGIRRQANRLARAPGGEENRLKNKGYEATLGYERSIRLYKKLIILPEAGAFYDHTAQQGYRISGLYSVPVSTARDYSGLYTELKFTWPLSRHISALAGLRVRAGVVHNIGISGTDDLGNALARPPGGFAVRPDQLSTISLRYTL